MTTPSLGKVKDIITRAHYGKVIFTRSEQFGDGKYLVVDHPGRYFHDRCRFVQLPSGSVLYFSSMMNDDVLKIAEPVWTYPVVSPPLPIPIPAGLPAKEESPYEP